MSDAYHDILGVRLPARPRCGSSRSAGRPRRSASPRSPASSASASRCSPGRSRTRASTTPPTRAIHNLLGAPGAIAADIVMQMLGLACIAALAPPAFWGWRLLTERRLAGPRRKAAFYLVGVAAATALASLLPAPGSWPLPTGLGGVVGDALLALPAPARGRSTWGVAAFGAVFAAIAILALTAASGVGFARRPAPTRRREGQARRRAPRRERTTRTARTSRDSASCRSAPSSMPC